MVDSEASGPVGVSTNPLDLALGYLLKGAEDSLLRQAGSILEQDPRRSVALLLAGRVLGGQGRLDAAQRALELAVEAAIDEGVLARAVATLCQLRALGRDTEAIETRLAEIFGKGSAHLMDHGAAPPVLVRQRLSQIPLPQSLGGDELAETVIRLIDHEVAQSDAQPRPADFKVPRQAFLSQFEPDALRVLLGLWQLRWAPAGVPVVRQGEPGEEAFLLARGEVEVVRNAEDDNNTVLARLGTGSLFGEMALLSRSPRAASVVPCRPSILLTARRADLEAAAAGKPAIGRELADFCRRRMIDNLVRTSSILSSVSPAERAVLIQRFLTRSFESGERIITQGHQAEGLHLIASGEVTVVHREQEDRTILARLTAGEVIGEMSLILRREANADVVAATPTVTLHLPREEFLGIAKAHPGILGHLYELAVARDMETCSIVAREATDADDLVLF